MPTLKNWSNFLGVNFGFAVYLSCVFFLAQVALIKKEWPLYRCNPIYMPLADNMGENFAYCIQSMQSNYMGFLLEPLTFITTTISGVIGGLLDEINSVRAMFDNIRTMFSDIFGNIFGVFLNLVIEFQKITIAIEDLIGKVIGVITTLLYVMDGSIQTMTSGFNTVEPVFVALGKCFYPNTNIKLKNGKIKHMKDIDLGDVLHDDSIVEAVMKINNKDNPLPLYVLKNAGENKTDIYVTGSHLVFDATKNKFVKIENYSKAQLSTLKTEWFSCLITSNHTIKIGEEIFWDWEDYIIKQTL